MAGEKKVNMERAAFLPLLEKLYYKEKLSQREIGFRLGISRWIVRDRMKRFGLRSRDKSEAISLVRCLDKESILPEVIRLYVEDGLSKEIIARKIDVSASTVGNWLRNSGVESRDRWKEMALRKERVMPEILRLYIDERESIRNIAKKLGISAQTIFSWFKQKGIKLRSRKESCEIAFSRDPKRMDRIRALSIAKISGKRQSPEQIAKRMVAWGKGHKVSEETRQKLRVSGKGRHNWTPEMRERMLPIVMRNRRQRPTALERRFQEIVDRHGLPYKYVGDGYTWIAGRCPDFLNVNGEKKVIEVFSRWWHDPNANPKVKPQHTDRATIEHFAKYGFDCIIIWEEDLSDELLVLQNIGKEVEHGRQGRDRAVPGHL